MTENNLFGASGSAQTKAKGSGDGTPKRSISVADPESSVVNYIMTAMRANDGLVEFPVFRDEATEVETILGQELPDELRELVESLPDRVETISIEDFFDIDLSGEGYEYVGTEPKLNQTDKSEWEDLPEDVKEKYTDEEKYPHGDESKGLKAYPTHPDWLEILRDGQLDSNVIYDISNALNGHAYDTIAEHLTDQELSDWSKVGVGVGKNYNNSDEFEKRRNVHFTLQNGKSSQSQLLNALQGAGTISQDFAQEVEDGQVTPAELLEEIRNSDEE